MYAAQTLLSPYVYISAAYVYWLMCVYSEPHFFLKLEGGPTPGGDQSLFSSWAADPPSGGPALSRLDRKGQRMVKMGSFEVFWGSHLKILTENF